MRLISKGVIALVLLLASAPVLAAERGAVIRDAELKAKPFVDAPAAANVTANQSVSVIGRQNGWVQVDAGGKTGWLRIFNVRLEVGGSQTASAQPAQRGRFSPTSLFTGSSGKTTTTGIKGVDEENLRNASVNYAQVQELGTLMVPADTASANAQQNGLKENKVSYLDKGDGK